MFVTLFGRGVGCCLATGLPLGCEAVFERGVRYSLCCTNPPRWRFPRWEYSGLEILLGEGGDVELGARTSKHIIVFAFDPISFNPFSFICAKHHSYHHIIFAWLSIVSYCHIYYMLVCVPHLYLTTRASHSTSTLI